LHRKILNMSLTELLESWRHDPLIAPNLVAWRTSQARPARTVSLPEDLPGSVKQGLVASGIHTLYSHQAETWRCWRAGRNIILATGTASGKTLAYSLPVISSLAEDPEARALYLFPTKALTQDQLTVLAGLLPGEPAPRAAIYDGDTPQKDRSSIRRNARIILTNPDMLHTGILPHHTNWLEFFSHLKLVVIDEAHTYRGVFGSHVANVLRRLQRVARFYGAHPQFILASATIGNPQELAGKLVEAPVQLIEEDGSSRGPRHFMIYNPPLADESLGLRKSVLLESVRLTEGLLSQGIQSVIFARSRRSVEIILTYLQSDLQQAASLQEGPFFPPASSIRGYRSGYLPSQRRDIEKGLRDGSVRAVVATNALELGIDIGGLGAAVLVGYPGSISSAWQQAGRAGRGLLPAAALLVASASPIDQFLAHHPEYFFDRSPEKALVNPDHLLILLEHLRCAMFELPFKKGEAFGALQGEDVEEFLRFLVENQEAHLSNDKYYWMADQYPAASISLRSADPQGVVLQAAGEEGRPWTVGTVDGVSAAWMVHPGAVYLHEALSYFVESLDLEQRIAHLRPATMDYYTEPLRGTTVEVLAESGSEAVQGATKKWGELRVTTQVTGFRKRRWYSHENLGEEPLELPPSELETTGYWITLADATIERLRESGNWADDPNDYGPGWARLRDQVRARDGFRCQVCGAPENGRQHHVHHKNPFRTFPSAVEANRLQNLATLCPSCHHKVEQNVRVRSGLAGLAYVLGNLAPLFLMCDSGDLGTHIESVPSANFSSPAVVLYDLVPAGIGFSQRLFEINEELLQRARELVQRCECLDGCPSCVGPGGENGYGGKDATLAILQELTDDQAIP
jgi:DEAD/DEAH box helicase domain-containing protein